MSAFLTAYVGLIPYNYRKIVFLSELIVTNILEFPLDLGK
jgi:hypothetical protein